MQYNCPIRTLGTGSVFDRMRENSAGRASSNQRSHTNPTRNGAVRFRAAATDGSSAKQDNMQLMVTVSIDHHAKRGKGPTDWDSFIAWAEANNPESVETLRRLREAGVVFFCEQEAHKATVGQSNSIFAYFPSVPEKGGVVA